MELREQAEAMRRQLDEEERRMEEEKRRREEEEGRKEECSVMIQAAFRGYDVRKVREVEKCVWYGWGCVVWDGARDGVCAVCVMSVSLCGAFSFIRVLNPSKMARLLYFDSSSSILLFHCRFIVQIVYHSIILSSTLIFYSLLSCSILFFISLLFTSLLSCSPFLSRYPTSIKS